jgi:hypothetical protein
MKKRVHLKNAKRNHRKNKGLRQCLRQQVASSTPIAGSTNTRHVRLVRVRAFLFLPYSIALNECSQNRVNFIYPIDKKA